MHNSEAKCLAHISVLYFMTKTRFKIEHKPNLVMKLRFCKYNWDYRNS